jgi:hypothetical protein
MDRANRLRGDLKMAKIKMFFDFIFSFFVTYNNVALTVCKNFFLETLPLALLTPVAAFIIHVVGWQVSCFKKMNYE